MIEFAGESEKELAVKTVADVTQFLDAQFPALLAESWDNTGLLVGDRAQTVRQVMTCLTLTPAVIDEAVASRAEFVVSHHPLPFRPVSQITSETLTGRSLLRIIESRIAVYSPHTRFDSASSGINDLLANRLGLVDPLPLVEVARDIEHSQGSGRYARLPSPLAWDAFLEIVKRGFGMKVVRGVAPADPHVHQIAIACGSGGSLLPAAMERGCDTFITGEMSFHSCLECEAAGIGVVLLGHYTSERFGIEELAIRLQQAFSDLTVWASEREFDPIGTF